MNTELIFLDQLLGNVLRLIIISFQKLTTRSLIVPVDKDIHCYLCINAKRLVDSFPDVVCWNIGLHLFRGKSA